jgi:hypothetical protein
VSGAGHSWSGPRVRRADSIPFGLRRQARGYPQFRGTTSCARAGSWGGNARPAIAPQPLATRPHEMDCCQDLVTCSAEARPKWHLGVRWQRRGCTPTSWRSSRLLKSGTRLDTAHLGVAKAGQIPQHRGRVAPSSVNDSCVWVRQGNLLLRSFIAFTLRGPSHCDSRDGQESRRSMSLTLSSAQVRSTGAANERRRDRGLSAP